MLNTRTDEINLNSLLLLQEIWKSIQENLKNSFLWHELKEVFSYSEKNNASTACVRVEAFKVEAFMHWTQSHPIVMSKKRSTLIFWTCLL